MKPLLEAHYPQEQIEQHIIDLIEKWKSGNPAIRACYPHAATADQAKAAIETTVRDEFNCKVYKNDMYQVSVREREMLNGEGTLIHLSIKRLDKAPVHDWRHFQEIKNQLVGVECEAVELYPAEDRLVDTANQYHLWCIPDGQYRFPFGFTHRAVTEEKIGNSVQRPFGEEVPA